MVYVASWTLWNGGSFYIKIYVALYQKKPQKKSADRLFNKHSSQVQAREIVQGGMDKDPNDF